jgi:inosose dehydratase
MRIANAPCSWGVLEFDSNVPAPAPGAVLDEIGATGYDGTELGDWGFLPTDPEALRRELYARRLSLVGAFVPVALSDASAHDDGEATAVQAAGLLRNASGESSTLIVLSDATAAVPARTAHAGRITTADGLGPNQWPVVGAGAERIARAVREATGLRTAFHHHCATYVETPEEIATLMRITSPELLGLCVDTGHATYGGGDPIALLREYRSRVWHVHFKDCSMTVANDARRGEWDYFAAVRQGLFCELGQGAVDFDAVIRELRTMVYDGWIVVEQDVLPSMGTPFASAHRNREFLATLGI